MRALRIALLLPFILAAFGYPTIALAQSTRVLVYVDHSGDDAVGEALAFATREELRRSAGYNLATVREAFLTINIVSVDISEGQKGSASAVSVAYTMTNILPFQRGNPQTWYDVYMTSMVLTVGRDRVDSQARSIMASLDAAMQKYREDMER